MILLCLIFTSCEKHNIIWTDLRAEKRNAKIQLGYSIDFTTKNDYFTLRTNKTKIIRARTQQHLMSTECPSYFCLSVHPTFIDTKDSEIEIFIYDWSDVKQTETGFEVSPKENVAAYFINYYDPDINRNYTIVSKDSIFENVPIAESNTKSAEEIINEIDSHDYAYFKSYVDQRFEIPIGGYILKSKVDGSYVWISDNIL